MTPGWLALLMQTGEVWPSAQNVFDTMNLAFTITFLAAWWQKKYTESQNQTIFEIET